MTALRAYVFLFPGLEKQAFQARETKTPLTGHQFSFAEREGYEPTRLYLINQQVIYCNLTTISFTLQLTLNELIVKINKIGPPTLKGSIFRSKAVQR